MCRRKITVRDHRVMTKVIGTATIPMLMMRLNPVIMTVSLMLQTLARRRELLRARALQRQEEELMIKQADEDKAQVTSEESSGGEDGDDYTDSDDDAAPRLKPVFVRKCVFLKIKI
jgi:hypothetical protein